MTVVINGTTGIDTGTGSLISADSTTPTYLDLFEDTDNGSNYVRLIAPTSVASNKTITLPDATGTMVVGSAAVSAVGQIPFSTDGSSYTPTAKIVSGTAITLTNQTAPEFTGIPSWVKRITVMFSGVSTNGTSAILVQLGNSGGIENTGYVSGSFNDTGSVNLTSTAGLLVNHASVAATAYNGQMIISLLGSNSYVETCYVYRSGTTGSSAGGGTKTTTGTLDRLRITTVNGTDTFDAGTINIIYE